MEMFLPGFRSVKALMETKGQPFCILHECGYVGVIFFPLLLIEVTCNSNRILQKHTEKNEVLFLDNVGLFHVW